MIIQLLLKKSLLLFLILIISSRTFSQGQHTDTLKPISYFKKHNLNTLKNDPDSIKNYYYNSLTKAIFNNDKEYHLLTLSYITEFYKQLNDVDSCKKYADLASSLSHKSEIKNIESNFRIHYALTSAYYNLNNDRMTIHHGQKSLEYLHGSDENALKKRINIYDLLSTSYLLLEKYDSVLNVIAISEQIINSMPKPSNKYILRNFWKRGSVLTAIGKRDEAKEELLKAIPFIDNENPLFVASNIYYDLGYIYFTYGELDKAIEYYQQVILVYKHLNQPEYPYYLPIRDLIADALFKLDNHKLAVEYVKENIRINLEHNDQTIQHDYQSLANMYMKMDSLALANTYLKRSFKILTKSYKKQKPITYANGISFYGQFKITKLHDKNGIELVKGALEIYKDYLGVKHPSVAKCYEYLGLSKIIFEDNPDEALSLYQAALMSNDSTFNTESIYQNPKIENALSKKKLLDILKDKADALSLKIQKSNNEIDCLEEIEFMNNTLLLAIQTIESIQTSFTSHDSKLKMNENTEELYQKLIASTFNIYRLTKKTDYLKKAYEYAERSKLTILNGLINEAGAKISGNVPKKILSQERELRIEKGQLEDKLNKIEQSGRTITNVQDKLRKDLFETNQKIDLIIANLEQNYEKYYQLKYRNRSLSVDSIQNKISEKQAIIEYYLTDTCIFEFVITKHTFSALKINSDSSLKTSIDSLANIFGSNSFINFDQNVFKSFKKNAHKLYQILIEPINNLITGKELIIIPDKKLLHLPFELLLTKLAQSQTNYRNLPYLINNHAISYSYSTEWLFQNTAQKLAQKNLLAIVPSYDKNADYKNDILIENAQKNRNILQPIPAALEEAKIITKLIKGNILGAEEATEARLKEIACEYSILHFAMHTIIDDKNPMFSKLVFTPTAGDSLQEEDNLLNTYEVFNLELNAQMVVLSSCQSGYGKIQKGEGIMSMARGFMFAGCPSLALTLWSVDDQSSSDLMSLYYQNLAKGLTKSVALQMAKKEFLKYADPIQTHPHFWAAHILVGDTQALELRKETRMAYYLFTLAILLILTLIFRRKLIVVVKEFLQPDRNKTLAD